MTNSSKILRAIPAAVLFSAIGLGMSAQAQTTAPMAPSDGGQKQQLANPQGTVKGSTSQTTRADTRPSTTASRPMSKEEPQAELGRPQGTVSGASNRPARTAAPGNATVTSGGTFDKSTNGQQSELANPQGTVKGATTGTTRADRKAQ